MAIRAKRKADRSDEYLAGVPNRDLEDEDYERLTAEQQSRDRGVRAVDGTQRSRERRQQVGADDGRGALARLRAAR